MPKSARSQLVGTKVLEDAWEEVTAEDPASPGSYCRLASGPLLICSAIKTLPHCRWIPLEFSARAAGRRRFAPKVEGVDALKHLASTCCSIKQVSCAMDCQQQI